MQRVDRILPAMPRLLAPLIMLALVAAAGAGGMDYPTPRSQGLTAGADPGWPYVAIPRKLRRPLHLPTLVAGQSCPVSERHIVDARFSPALGAGPAYPAVFDENSTLHFAGANFPAPWTGNKVLWLVSPRYRGPVLLRGRQLDAAFSIGFNRGSRPYSELHLQGDGRTWVNFPSYTRVRGAGCFAYQIDGTTFSRAIVFRAAP
jgi:hypothetical protein